MRSDEEIKVVVYSFDREMVDKPWDDGEVVFQTSASMMRLKSQFLNQADRILSSLGTAGYKELWGFDFSIDNYNAIKNT